MTRVCPKKTDRVQTVWSEADEDRMTKMYFAGMSREEIAGELGRSEGSVGSHMKLMRSEGRLGYRTKKPVRIKQAPVKLHDRINPTPEMYEEAARRASATRSLTAVMFGDPPRGYSALDRRCNNV